MVMYESILIPTDGSQKMESVVDQGLELAKQNNATVHSLYVVDERAYLAIPDEERDHVRKTLEEDGQATTKAIEERILDAGLDVIREIRCGDPSAEILTYAVENEIELIVMGTHGRTGYERYLLGSVAERVVRTAPIPVLTIAVGNIDKVIANIQDRLRSESAIEATETVSETHDQVDELPDS